MRYEPTQQELSEMSGMDEKQRLHYFLTRTLESEEVWALADNQGWVMREHDQMTILPLWPYQQFAHHCIDADDLVPSATSLDHFVESVLPHLAANDIYVEVLPVARQGGTLLPANGLQEMFRSLMESGEYFLEG